MSPLRQQASKLPDCKAPVRTSRQVRRPSINQPDQTSCRNFAGWTWEIQTNYLEKFYNQTKIINKQEQNKPNNLEKILFYSSNNKNFKVEN